MAAPGLFGDGVGVKVDRAGLAELAALPGSGPFGPEQRPMAGYLWLPGSLPAVEKTAWMTRAYDHVVSLPSKEKKVRLRRTG